jgi:hypothetical protein
VLKVSYYWDKLADFAEKFGIIITLALLPIDRLPYIHYTPFGLGLISLILLLVASTRRLLDIVVTGNWQKMKRYLFVGFLLMLPSVGYGISSFYAIDHSYALSATKSLLAVCLRAFCFFVLVLENPALWRLIRKTIYIVTAAVVSFGFLQFVLDVFGVSPRLTDLRGCCTSNSTYVFPRVYSTALEPLYFDHFLMIPLWLLTFDFWRNKNTRSNRHLQILFIATASLFILTIARSATVSLILAGLIFLWGMGGIRRHRELINFLAKAWGKALLSALVLILFSGMIAIFIPKNARYNDTGFGSLKLFGGHAVDVNDGSAHTRYDLWPKSVSLIESHPLEGVGANNSRIELNIEKYRQGAAPNRLQPFNNDLIALAVDLGLLALVFFGPLFAFLLRAFYQLFKKGWNSIAAPFALILVGMLIQGNFFQSLLLTRLWVVIGLLLAFLYAPAFNQASASQKRIVGKKKTDG